METPTVVAENVGLEFRPFAGSSLSSIGSFDYMCLACAETHRAAITVEPTTPTNATYKLDCPNFKGPSTVTVCWPSYAEVKR